MQTLMCSGTRLTWSSTVLLMSCWMQISKAPCGQYHSFNMQQLWQHSQCFMVSVVGKATVVVQAAGGTGAPVHGFQQSSLPNSCVLEQLYNIGILLLLATRAAAPYSGDNSLTVPAESQQMLYDVPVPSRSRHISNVIQLGLSSYYAGTTTLAPRISCTSAQKSAT